MTGTSRSSELCAHTDALSSSTSTNISGSFIEPCRIAEINTALVSEPELAANMAARSEVAGSLVDGICCIPMMAATNPSGLEFNKTKKNTRRFLNEACSCALGVESLKANAQRFRKVQSNSHISAARRLSEDFRERSLQGTRTWKFDGVFTIFKVVVTNCNHMSHFFELQECLKLSTSCTRSLTSTIGGELKHFVQ
jgi:hypothetical protein